MQRPPSPDSEPNEPFGPIDPKIDDYDLSQVTEFLFRRQTLLAIVLLVFVVTRLWMLLTFQVEMADTSLYALLARQGNDLGEVPYRDFDVYYPPVAWWLMEVPRLVDSEKYQESKLTPERADRFFREYYGRFHLQLCLADAICLALMWAIGRRLSPTAELVLPAAYTLLSIAQPHLLYDRLDIVLLMFLLLTIYCWLRSLPASAGANGWACASYLFLGLGISFKVVPLVCVPYLLLADLLAWGSFWRFAGLVFSLLVGGLGPFLAHMPAAGWSVFSLFMFHGERPIHLESIWSSAMLVASALFVVPCKVVHSHGGWNLAGDWTGPVKLVAALALLTMAASIGLWALLRARRYDRRLALDCALLVLVNSTVLSMVFSPQYLNWMLPLAVLLALNVLPRSVPLWCGFAAQVVAIVGISSWLFPHHFLHGLVARQTLPVVLSVMRSACMAGLAVLLSICFFAKYGLVPWRTESPKLETESLTV